MTTDAPQKRYIVATDVGGTCTDTIVVAPGEAFIMGKALSTPPNFADGVLDSIARAADQMGLGVEDLFAQTYLFMHGSTVVDNTLLTRGGAPTGLITTAGFEDTVFVTRGAYGRWAGQPEDWIKHPVASDRPAPLIPEDAVCGVPERVDYKGRGAAAAGRGGDRTGGPAPGRRKEGRGHRRRLPVVLLQCGERAEGP